MRAPPSPLDLAMLPQALIELDQWVVWRLEARDGKPTKVPYCAGEPERRASTTDRSTWASFEQAAAVVAAGGVDGLGFVFAADDPFCGVDLDAAASADDRAAVLGLDSYAEVSLSGTGIHVIVRASLNGHARRRSGPFEVYDHGRYFVCTGDHVPGTPLTVEERQAELEALVAHFLPLKSASARARPAQPVELDDRELLDKAFAAKNGDKFRRLWGGDTSDYGGDDSAADQALCNLLAFWTGRDPDRMAALFRSSGLYREKWERADYREATITKAIAASLEAYTPRTATPSPTPSRPRPQVPPVTPSPVPTLLSGDGDGHPVPVPVPEPGEDDPSEELSSWVPIDIVALSARPPEPPAIIGLFYPGHNHLNSGESEALKTWLMAAASADEMLAGRGVLWVDGDDVGPAAVLERLRLFGVADETISERFAYVLPDKPLDTDGHTLLLGVVEERSCRLAVFDGFNPLLLLHGLDPNVGNDVERFYRLLDPIRKRGVAVVVTDNVVKSAEARGAWAIGSERKKSKAEVHLGMKVIQPLVRGGVGRAKITVHKDRPGFLTRPSPGLFVVDATDGLCSWAVEQDESRGDEGVFRPTALMERVSRFLELAQGPRSRTQTEEGAKGKAAYVRQAIDVLCAEGYCEEFEGERRARMVRLVRVYRAADDDEVERLDALRRQMEEEGEL